MAGWPTVPAEGSAEQLAASRAAVWRWVLGGRCSLNRALLALFLIASCARSAWARGVFSIKDGLVAPCGGRQLATEGWYTRMRVCFRLKPVIHAAKSTGRNRLKRYVDDNDL